MLAFARQQFRRLLTLTAIEPYILIPYDTARHGVRLLLTILTGHQP
jgi:hypothetical protein